MIFKRHKWAIAYSLALIAFTGYLAVDTFAISRVYTVVETEKSNTDNSSSYDNVVSTQTAYSDDNVTISLTEY